MQKYLACGATSKRYLHVSEIDDKADVLGDWIFWVQTGVTISSEKRLVL